MGILRTVQFVGTLVVVGPVILIGIFKAIEGDYQQSVAFLGVAIAFIIVSEYLYLSVVDRTFGRLKRLKNIRGDEE